jgi:hypothetical protein
MNQCVHVATVELFQKGTYPGPTRAFPSSIDSRRTRNGFEDPIGLYAKYEFDAVPEMI